MRWRTARNILISIFVIFWIAIFHYESTRYFYLEPMLGHKLPKTKFLFPPAGWIMFYNVGPQASGVEVFGIKDGAPQIINPHDILETRYLGFDNIRRGGLSAATDYPQDFCRYLRRKFSYFDSFFVTVVFYPDPVENRQKQMRRVLYQCK